MRLMWQRWGKDFYSARQTTGHGLPEDGFPAIVEEATGLDLRTEIAAWAYGTGDLPLSTVLAPFGVRIAPAADPGGAAIGARVAAREGGLVVLSAERNGPAAAAGLSAGDLIIAVDALRMNDARLKTLLARRTPGSRVTVHAFRREQLYEASMTLGKPFVESRLTLAAMPSCASRLLPHVAKPMALKHNWHLPKMFTSDKKICGTKALAPKYSSLPPKQM